MDEYHKCSKCGFVTYGLDGFFEMMKHTNICQKKVNKDGFVSLFNTYEK